VTFRSRAAYAAAFTAAGLAAAPASAMAAELLHGVTDQNRLVRFASDSPGDVSASVQVTGLLQADERILGIDVRPNNDALYAVTSANRLYTVNPLTGSARAAINPLDPPLNGTLFGVDVNPAADALRIVSDADQNLRFRFSDGRGFTDGGLSYAGGDPGAGSNPNVTAVAYTNSVPGATSTTLLGIDVARDALVRQDPPNAGTLNTVGALGFDATDVPGFDIAANGNAYAAVVRGGAAPELVRIDLANGRAANAAESPGIVLPEGSGALRGLAVAGGAPDDGEAPGLSVAFSSTILESNTDTLRPSVSCDETCAVTVSASVDGARAGSGTAAIVGGAGRETVEVRLSSAARGRIARSGTELIRLTVVATDAAGNRRTQRRVSRTQTLAGRQSGG
jgi:Domain of unknown function (DUF4394)